jgi:KDO2-lipid IV(A) lauroyltransferase
MLRSMRRFCAYLLVKVLLAGAKMLPRRLGGVLFGNLGALAYVFLKKSRKTALVNLRLVYGRTIPDKEIRDIARAAFVNLGKFAYDVARVGRENPENLKRNVRVSGVHHMDQALARGKGVIALTGHIGNWELLGAYLSLMGYPVNVLVTRLKDGRLNDLLVGLRRKVGLRVLERSKGLKGAFRCLKRGEVLGILIDQDTSVESVTIDFLGHPARTAVGPVKLASRTGASIVPLAMLMAEDGRYHMQVKEPIRVDGEDGSLESEVERCSKAVENFISKKPSQWVWMHKRWKSLRSDMYR